MLARRQLAAALGLGALWAAGCEASAPPPGQGAPPPATVVAGAPALTEPATVAGADVTWIERTSEGGEGASGLPLVVGIHGLGDAPERFCRIFEGLRTPARLACPRGFSRHGANGWSWFPPRAAPTDRAQRIGEASDRLARAIAALAAERGAARVVVTGFSQGGALAFALAVRHGDRVAQAVPIGGWLPDALRPSDGARTAPILALHGEADEVVPLGPTREAIGWLSAHGHAAELRPFPGVAHAVPPEVRSALFEAVGRALESTQALDRETEKREKEDP